MTEGGHLFGTLCCFSHAPMPDLGEHQELEALKSVAALVASALGREDG